MYSEEYGTQTSKSKIVEFGDADYSGCPKSCKSMSGYVFMSSCGAFCWKSIKQMLTVVATTEAEYVALVASSQEAVWLRPMFSFVRSCSKATPHAIRTDNQAAMNLAQNDASRSRTKTIDA